ncbi:MAG: 6-bladed beta-propeller [Phycisphaerae bacterium]
MTRCVMLLLLGVGALAGCRAAPTGPVFPAAGPRPLWPAPPDPPRIEYLGELRGESTLRARRAPTLGELLTGERVETNFVTPTAVAADGDTLFVADPNAAGGPAIHRVELAERKLATFRDAGGAPFEWPIDLTLAGDILVIADAKRGAVYLLDRAGRPQGALGADVLKRPASVAWDAQQRELWVLDAGAHACVVFDLAGGVRRTVGRRGLDPGSFNFPAGLAVAADGSAAPVAIADAMNFRVQLLARDGAPQLAFGKKGDAAGDFSLPRDVAIDRAGRLFVLDNQFENVQVFDPAGRLLMAWGEEGAGPGQFALPAGITIDAQQRVWIADTYNRRVQVFRILAEDGA